MRPGVGVPLCPLSITRHVDTLAMQIETNLYERFGQAITNFKRSLPKVQSDLVRESLKDPYRFDFLGIRRSGSGISDYFRLIF